MANFMARYRCGDGRYADVECSYAELERYLVLSCNEQSRYWKQKEGHQTGGLKFRENRVHRRKDAAHNPNHKIAIGVSDLLRPRYVEPLVLRICRLGIRRP